jgi:hypothetical protein
VIRAASTATVTVWPASHFCRSGPLPWSNRSSDEFTQNTYWLTVIFRYGPSYAVRRRWWGILVFGLLFLAVFGATDLSLVIQIFMMTTAGLLFLLGGIGYELGPVSWYQFVGSGCVLLGLNLCIQFVVDLTQAGSSNEELLFAGLAAIGGLSLAYIGFDWIRGGTQFDLSQFDSSLS